VSSVVSSVRSSLQMSSWLTSHRSAKPLAPTQPVTWVRLTQSANSLRRPRLRVSVAIRPELSALTAGMVDAQPAVEPGLSTSRCNSCQTCICVARIAMANAFVQRCVRSKSNILGRMASIDDVLDMTVSEVAGFFQRLA